MTNSLLPMQTSQRREAVVAYGWASPTVGFSAEAQAQRIRRHCQSQGWEVASELLARRFPELIELARRAVETDARRIVLTQEAVADLERRFPEVWGEIRARLIARRVAIVVC